MHLRHSPASSTRLYGLHSVGCASIAPHIEHRMVRIVSCHVIPSELERGGDAAARMRRERRYLSRSIVRLHEIRHAIVEALVAVHVECARRAYSVSESDVRLSSSDVEWTVSLLCRSSPRME